MAPNAEIEEFFRQGLAGGKTADELRAALAAAGWAAADIDAGFAASSAPPAGAAQGKKGRMLWLWIGLGFLGLAAIGAAAYFLVAGRPSASPGKAPGAAGNGNRPAAGGIAAEDNAYFSVSEKFSQIGRPWTDAWSALLSADADLGKSWNPTVASDILAAYKDDLAAFASAAAKPRYQEPAGVDSSAHAEELRVISRLAALDAYTKAQTGAVSAGRAEASLVADYGAKMAGSGLADSAAACGMIRTGLDAWKLINSLAAPSADDQAAVSSKLDAYAGLNGCRWGSYISDFKASLSQAPAPSSGASASSVAAAGESDFSLPKEEVPAADNAYLSPADIASLSSLTEGDYTTADAIAATSAVGNKESDALAEKGQAVVAAFVAAAAKPRFQIPGYADPASVDQSANDSVRRLRAVGGLIVLDANRRIGAGDADAAVSDALALIAYGEKVAMSQAALNGYALGLTMRDNGLIVFLKIKAAGLTQKLSAASSAKALAAIAGLADTGPGLAKAMKMNYWLSKSLIADASKNSRSLPPELSSKVSDPFYFDAQSTLDAIAGYEREGIAMATAACQVLKEPESVNLGQINQIAKASYKNVVGDYIIANVKSLSNERWNNWRCSHDAADAAAAALSGAGGR